MGNAIWLIKQYTDGGTTTVGYCLTREDALAWIATNNGIWELCNKPLQYYLDRDDVPPIIGPPKLYRVILSLVPPTTVSINEGGDVTGAIVVRRECIEYNPSLLNEPHIYLDGDRLISIGYSDWGYYDAMLMAMEAAKYDHHKYGYPEDSFPEGEG